MFGSFSRYHDEFLLEDREVSGTASPGGSSIIDRRSAYLATFCTHYMQNERPKEFRMDRADYADAQL
jgi:hypothetical protein